MANMNSKKVAQFTQTSETQELFRDLSEAEQANCNGGALITVKGSDIPQIKADYGLTTGDLAAAVYSGILSIKSSGTVSNTGGFSGYPGGG